MFKLDDDYEILPHDDGHGKLVENQYLVISNDEDQPAILIDATPLDDPAPKALAQRLMILLNTVRGKPTNRIVSCKFCRRGTPLLEAHRHQDGWVCDMCWDERLRASA